ncbi:MAG: hypothetical protein BWK73_28455 [Thiothrix lacustris]|uniref:SH3b domain-containing protein n=1 Tax=Thiothrix lacustris TaxID=525917 RepID=A0A1Y1QJS1_9GAMM|nr:MAG: hypothetical protein BWK73_28455 [Thiothrix lacustris]
MLAGWLEQRYFRIEKLQVSMEVDVRLRVCPKPRDTDCPTLVKIPMGSEVIVYKDIAYYDRDDGQRVKWRKVEYMQWQGWVNGNLLIE